MQHRGKNASFLARKLNESMAVLLAHNGQTLADLSLLSSIPSLRSFVPGTSISTNEEASARIFAALIGSAFGSYLDRAFPYCDFPENGIAIQASLS
jgi:hypothetical protein